MSERKSDRKCFLISPIGEAGSEIRDCADHVLTFLRYEIFTKDCDYEVVRSDESITSNITDTMINGIVDSDLAIAFLENDNPNVYYEIGVRHSVPKSCITIVSEEYRREHPRPFDLYNVQQIEFCRDSMMNYVNGSSLDANLREFKRALMGAIRECENQGDGIVQNPVTRARQDFIIPPRMTTEKLIQQVLDTWKEDVKDEFVRTIADRVADVRKDAIAEYIDGEEKAFKKLAEMTRKAQRTLRTTRFAPQAISETQNSYKTDFFNALCEFGKKSGVTCTRIMCMNEPDKLDDLWNTITKTAGGSMELYLTRRSNNFELVVIDDQYAFLHFYDDNTNRRIKSTLFISKGDASREFDRIYCHFLDDKGYEFHIIKCSDCAEPDQQAAAYNAAKAEFKELATTLQKRNKLSTIRQT